MKKGLMILIFSLMLLSGCTDEVKDDTLSMMDSITVTTEDVIVAPVEDVTHPTTQVKPSVKNYYIEVETTKKEKRGYSLVFKSYDECLLKGKEFLPTIATVYPEIIGVDCMYLKDDANHRYWGVIFKTCNDPATICNFYY